MLKHAVIFAHPREQSFVASMAEAYIQSVEKLGHRTVCRDLYRIGFEPCLGPDEIPGPGFKPAADVEIERSLLRDCDVFALVYPLWLNTPPAIMKGYLERVFGFGFAYGGHGSTASPQLTGKKLIAFSSSGAPLDWVKESGSFFAVQSLFDFYFSTLCGLEPIDHVHFGNVIPGASADFVQARLGDVRKAVTRHFGSET